MLVLGIDTATRIGSVGLVRLSRTAATGAGSAPTASAFGSSPVETLQVPHLKALDAESIGEVSRDAGGSHGATLLELIDSCLAGAGVALGELGGIAISVGPGSFTGLRVGLATAKGLALSLDVRLVGISTLEALALAAATEIARSGSATAPGLLCACLDARKGEVYAALFSSRSTAGPLPDRSGAAGTGSAIIRVERLTQDTAQPPEDLARLIGARIERSRIERTRLEPPGGAGNLPRPEMMLVGDGAERYHAAITGELAEHITVLPFERFHPRGEVIARLGAARLARGEVDDLASLAPAYARASEAELKRAPSIRDPARSAPQNARNTS